LNSVLVLGFALIVVGSIIWFAPSGSNSIGFLSYSSIGFGIFGIGIIIMTFGIIFGKKKQ
jgi:hypothetical protein